MKILWHTWWTYSDILILVVHSEDKEQMNDPINAFQQHLLNTWRHLNPCLFHCVITRAMVFMCWKELLKMYWIWVYLALTYCGCFLTYFIWCHIDGLAQDCSNCRIFTLFYHKRFLQHTHSGANMYVCTRVVYMRVCVHTRMCVHMGTRMDLLICAYMCLGRRVRVCHSYLPF